MARITLDHIAHSYYPDPKGPEDYALKHIHTSWDDGGAYALLGPSGCGKTTMLNVISGLLTPSEGKVLYDGQDMTALPPEKRNIAQVFQFPVLYDTMTVYNNLAFPLRNRGVAADEINKKVHEVAEVLDLSEFLNKRAAGLSADAKQKISVGRGLVRADVAAILFDEPLTVIDPQLKWHLRRKLKEIQQRFHHTLIYVTHDQVEALTLADKVMLMYEGEIVQTGSPDELFENPQHKFVGYFIGSPGMNFLPCSLDGNLARVNGTSIRLSDEMAALGSQAKGETEIGIRPMYLEVNEKETEDSVAAQVMGVEDQGSFKVLTMTLAKNVIKARITDGRPVPESTAWLRFPPDKIKLFADQRLVR
jgi:glycerol transport system ATP-binding protein